MSSSRSSLLPGLILACALALTWLIWDHERQAARQELKSHFDFALSEAVSRIDQRMAAYDQMLRGAQGLITATGKMDRQLFHDYVEALQIDANLSGMQVLGLIEQVPASRKTPHIAAMRRQGFADYRIEPDGERAFYAPVIQREPYLGLNRAPPGFDPWSDPVRQTAMERARDSGMASISGKVRLAIEREGEASPGFVMYLPIYARNQPLETVEQRRQNLQGWVFASFRMSDLMASLYGELPPGLALSLYDGVDDNEAALLSRSREWNKSPAIMTANEYLVVAGHNWLLSLAAQEAFASRFGRNAEDLIALCGIVFSLLAALLAWELSTTRARALRLAATMTHDLRESEQRWAFALEGAGDGVWDWNRESQQIITSERWREIMGYEDNRLAFGFDEWKCRIHPDDLLPALRAMHACMEEQADGTASCVAEYRVRAGENQWKWVLSRGMTVSRSADGQPERIIGTITDISERKAIEERIQHMAQHDALTDLPNRALFSDRLQLALANANRRQERLSLVFLDLDHFKPVNDHYGHAVGDQLLQQVARRLQETVRTSDTVGRIGGDEFVILMPELQEISDAHGLAEKIRKALDQPFMIDGHQLNISCSLGIAIYPEHGKDEISLAKSADSAMYRAKESGRNSVCMA